MSPFSRFACLGEVGRLDYSILNGALKMVHAQYVVIMQRIVSWSRYLEYFMRAPKMAHAQYVIKVYSV
jgi:hypothetical protein